MSDVANQIAANQGDFKLLRTLTGSERLFDVVRDPGCTNDLSAEWPEVVIRLRAWLDAIVER